MIHYHGTPISPTERMLELAGCCFCVSHAAHVQVQLAHDIGQSVMLDNGAFSAWRRGHQVDVDAFFAWAYPWTDYHTTWAVIPDVIDGSIEDNNYLVHYCEQHCGADVARRFAPVWHVHEPIARLVRLADHWPRVCIGSSGEYAQLGTPRWYARMDEAFNKLCGNGPPPVWLHMLRGMDMSDGPYPFASVDSVNISRNLRGDYRDGDRRAPKDVRRMASRLDAMQAPACWKVREPHPQLEAAK